MPDQPRSENVTFHAGTVDRAQRVAATGHEGTTVWLTGLSGSGKSTVAVALEQQLVSERIPAYLLDGDNLRHGLNGDLGFDAVSRAENVRRAGEVALLFADAGVVAIVPLISPYREDRDRVRRRHEDLGLRFVEVFVDTPIELCEQRDPKGLYAKARAGEITGFTGVDDPYEAPVDPDVTLRPGPTPEVAAAIVAELLGIADP
jgi:bifunctional enzyme CysN/CysC